MILNEDAMNAQDKLSQIPVSPLCPLDECAEGTECEICRLNGEAAERLRLLNLGFREHSTVRLVQVRNNHYIVSVDGSRFALSRELAHNICVQPADQSA